MSLGLWNACLKQLESELSAQDFNTWLRPLHGFEDAQGLHLLAPNRFVLEWVKQHFYPRIVEVLTAANQGQKLKVLLQVGSRSQVQSPAASAPGGKTGKSRSRGGTVSLAAEPAASQYSSPLNRQFTFQTFVSGGSNQLARAAAMQSLEHSEFNPLYIYGGVGLGKTHLMQAVGNQVLKQKPDAKVVYLHTERFVAGMVKALQSNAINEFKRFYRSADVLLVDDVQFLASKVQSQEEFLHTFNSLMEEQCQLVVTCDRLPREIKGMEDRLKSRLSSGLAVEIQPPALETRVNILIQKAQTSKFQLPEDVAVFIARHIETSVRELEGALRRLLASARLMHESINVDYAQETLKDLLSPKRKISGIDDIQHAVADYFKIALDDLHSKSRRKLVVRPRQIAMSLSKELTEHSLPEIGKAFGGRDRTTVLHSCKAVAALQQKDMKSYQDYLNLLRLLS